jgi:predicted aspartyl protease
MMVGAHSAPSRAMGTFQVEVEVANPAAPTAVRSARLLVDTGSAYTWILASALRSLEVNPNMKRRVMTIQGQVVERLAAEVLMTIDGQTMHTLCLFGEPGELEVLGAVTLEQFGLAVDPVQRRLVSAIPYGA